jgi:energy-coupling factor transporter transmembrane protein EcfT
LPAALFYKVKTQTEKALKFTLTGIYLIFLISSFRGKVEVNWTMPALIPLIVLSHQFILDKIPLIRPLRIVAFVSLLLVIAGRVYLVVDIGPDNSLKGRFHNNRSWAKAITDKTGDAPVVFYNSYQRASLFWFYSGKLSHSHNSYSDRKSNYNFWPTESNLLGKNIFIADIYGIGSFSDSVKTKKGWVGLSSDSMYAALGAIKIISGKKSPGELDHNLITIKFASQIPGQYQNFLQTNSTLQTELIVGVFNGKDLLKEIQTGITAQQIARQTKLFEIQLSNLPKSSNEIRLGIRSKNYLITHNSETIHITGL